MKEKRCHWMSTIRSLMLNAMVCEFDQMAANSKCEFLLSGLNNCYVPEWNMLYGAVAQFIWDIYRYRDEKYKNMSEI